MIQIMARTLCIDWLVNVYSTKWWRDWGSGRKNFSYHLPGFIHTIWIR